MNSLYKTSTVCSNNIIHEIPPKSVNGVTILSSTVIDVVMCVNSGSLKI